MATLLTDDMPEKMRRFLARKPRRAVRDKARSYPRSWLKDCIKEQGSKCHYCRKRIKTNPLPVEWDRRATIDHVVPLSAGGENKRRNVVAACIKCNQDKGSMPADEFLATLQPPRR
jgi:5-methylcytosine-specific restriction endonuclease McrA